MLNRQGGDGVVYIDRLAGMATGNPEIDLPMVSEARRIREMQAAARVPVECGPDIVPSIARGGFVLHMNVELLPIGSEGVAAVHRGYGGRPAIRRADPFDAMQAAAARAGRPSPMMPSQIAIGRRYHDLVELLSADGVKLSQLQASFGGGGKTDWMDQRMVYSDEVARLRRRIGTGACLQVRRIRPSDRGPNQRGTILDRVLVDMFCLMGYGIKAVLRAHGWQADGRNQKVCREALCGALDRMIGLRAEKSS